MDDRMLVGAIGASVALLVWFAPGVDAGRLVRRLRAAAARVREVAARPSRRGARSGAPGGRRVGLGEVAEMVDVVRLGLSAGLSFDASLGMYCEQAPGPLALSMARACLSWQMGMETREEGLSAVARETGVRQLESFSAAVAQAHELGAPLVDTLARQAREMRAAHRAAVERRIEQAPVKMLIPTGTLILPALLLSIVGPLLAAGGMI